MDRSGLLDGKTEPAQDDETQLADDEALHDAHKNHGNDKHAHQGIRFEKHFHCLSLLLGDPSSHSAHTVKGLSHRGLHGIEVILEIDPEQGSQDNAAQQI